MKDQKNEFSDTIRRCLHAILTSFTEANSKKPTSS